MLRAVIAFLLVTLSGCAATHSNSSGTSIEGPSNEESLQEAAEVQAVISSSKPQPFPNELEGCWKGAVSKVDSFTRELQAPADSILTLDCCEPVEYALCFDRASAAASFSAPTLNLKMVSQWFKIAVVPIDAHTNILFSTGDNFAVVRSVGHYQVRCGVMTARMSSQTNLRATYVGSDQIYVEATAKSVCSDSRILNCDGQPWAESTWHGRFTRELANEITVGGRE
jgi:hypothetical protein